MRGKGVALSSAAAGLWQIRGRRSSGYGQHVWARETGRRCFHPAGRSNSWHHRRPQKGFWAPVMRVTTISQEETGCGQADCSIMQGTCKLHGPASHCALAFLLDAALPSAGGNSPKYAKSMLFEGTKMLGALTLSFFHRSRYTGKTDFGRRAPLLGLGRKSRRTYSLKGIVPEVAAHVSVLLGLHIISDGLTSFQTDSNTHQQVSGQGSCCPCCAIGPLTSSPAASRASSSLVS